MTCPECGQSVNRRPEECSACGWRNPNIGGNAGGNPPPQPGPAPKGDGVNTCRSCGKGMTVQGLNKTYPPKKDTAGTVICPHCAAPQSQSTNGPNTIHFGPAGPYRVSGFGTASTVSCHNCLGRISGFVVSHECDCANPEPYYCDARGLAMHARKGFFIALDEEEDLRKATEATTRMIEEHMMWELDNQQSHNRDTCRRCGKGMTITGLNREYPPKRDAAGTVICPHCEAPQSQSTVSIQDIDLNKTGYYGFQQLHSRDTCWLCTPYEDDNEELEDDDA